MGAWDPIHPLKLSACSFQKPCWPCLMTSLFDRLSRVGDRLLGRRGPRGCWEKETSAS